MDKEAAIQLAEDLAELELEFEKLRTTFDQLHERAMKKASSPAHKRELAQMYVEHGALVEALYDQQKQELIDFFKK